MLGDPAPQLIATLGDPHQVRFGELRDAMLASHLPALLFDYDSARITHLNTPFEHLTGRSAAALVGQTGRSVMPKSCGVLADVISESLLAHDGYSGPISLLASNTDVCRRVDMRILRDGDRKYGLDVYSAMPTLPTPSSVLIVDDNPFVLRAVARALRNSFPIRTAGSVVEAVRHLSADLNIGAVLSDVHMPGLGGGALYDAVRAFRPDLLDAFIFHSGAARPHPRAGVPLIDKPASPKLLREALTAALARGPARSWGAGSRAGLR